MSSWVILVDNLKDLSNTETPHKVMTVREYLTHPKLFTGAKPTILNLSRSYAYQGQAITRRFWLKHASTVWCRLSRR